ncbi:MAG: hypothetical protein JO157_01275 [Acetobacteraceae bacterium]|nr:hypothetical protein [Acetobacteraceae bacterium]
MAGDFWEQAVETYLALDRWLFLNPQYLIGTPGVWEANPDFLAVAFPDNTVWMVEVTKSPRGSLFGKIDSFEHEYVPKIKDQLREHRVIRGDEAWAEWAVGLWIFAPDTALSKLESRMRAAGVQKWLVTSLEKTTAPAWEDRFR